MRFMITAVFLALLAVPAFADDKKDDEKKKDEPKLKVGDAAPALKADKWLQGTVVKSFEPGKIYVVEFWATWCGPCIVMMPHMAEMQTEYREQGVTFIGYTAKDPNNTAEKVAEFVKKRGPKLGYTFAYSDDKETYDAWMKAAQQGGIPCSFVVDKKGKIAYFGHPMFLGVVLPKVVAGTWVEADVKNLDEVEKDVNKVFAAINKPDAEAGLAALTEFETKYPPLAHVPYFIGPKIMLLFKNKKVDEGKKLAKEVTAKAMAHDDSSALFSVSRAVRLPGQEKNKELVALSLDAAEAGLKIAGDKDLGGLLNLADAHFYAGDKAKAREAGAKAVDAAPNARIKEQIEKMIKKYEDEKKEQKKDK